MRRPPPALLALLVVPALAAGATLLAPAAATAAPTISGADGDVWNASDPTPTYTVTASARVMNVSWSVAGVAEGDGGNRPRTTARLSRIPDGEHQLVATERLRSDPGDPGSSTTRRFVVDRTPPTIVVRSPAAGAEIDAGAVMPASYSCAGATTCAGTVPDGQPIDTATPGRVEFTVRATDAAGNETVRRVRYTVRAASGASPPAPAPAPAPDAAVARQAPPAAGEPAIEPAGPATLNAQRLRPRPEARVTTRRPTLRWAPRAGARLYNVQLWRLRGTVLTKVVSAFPTRPRLRVPAGRLAFGERYVWRVWPLLRSGRYSEGALGVSYFDVERPVRLTAGQLLVNQRISQAALRRTGAIDRWLDGGISAGDLRDGSIGADRFARDVRLAGSGAPRADGPATPRPLVVPPAPRRADRRALAVTARQLLINQRISQAAVRRANALQVRLEGRLTGGDLAPGAITQAELAPGLRVASSSARASAPAPSTTEVPDVARDGDGRRAVRLTAAQVLVNQRISQAAVRRANRLRGLVERGLTGSRFRPGSITSASLAPGVDGRRAPTGPQG